MLVLAATNVRAARRLAERVCASLGRVLDLGVCARHCAVS